MNSIEINTEIKDFNGRPVAMIGKECMTIRDAAMQQVGSYRTKDGKKALEAYALGMKLAGCKEGALVLETAEYNLMKEIVAANPAGMAVVANVPVLQAINDASPVKADA